jgi:hypothetical protein
MKVADRSDSSKGDDMRTFLTRLAAAVAGVVLGSLPLVSFAQATQPATKQADVPVKAVVLFSSGVGYFEHFGTVRGDGSTELMFKTGQINDILKSLVLQDLDGGKVSTITYPSQDPIARTLKSFQIDLSSNPNLGDLLNQLRGTQVIVTLPGEQIGGTILGVEKKQRPVGDKGNPVEVHVLNVLAEATIRSVELDEVRGIAIQNEELQAELNMALAALAQARDQDKKPVQIGFRGEGDRRVRIGYVVETPIWKTSYRLVMSEAAESKPHLQGWAIVENQTDNDWTNVQLSLVSGRPISFIQDLYQPLYIPRPVVQPELYASLTPQMYEEGMEQEAKEADRFRSAGRREMKQAQAPAAAAPADAAGGYVAARERAPMIDPTASVTSVASAARIGELFQYTVGNVSLPRQKSAMIPIITDPVEVEKLSIYNQNVLPKHPLNGARVKNTTDKHLLQGPITVFESNSYAGDARIDNTPPGTERLISYGIDLQMLVDATKNNQTSAIQTGRIVKGVLYVTRKHVHTQDYLAENKSDRGKTLIIEHPIRHGWKLVNTDKPIETTEAIYRFKGTVEPGKTSKLTVTEEIVQDESIAILPADIGQLDFYSKRGEIPQQVRDALAKAIAMKHAMTETQRQINERNQQIASITQEQNRIRENMRTVNQQSEYYNRLLKKLNDQESQIERLQSERDDLQRRFESQRKELEEYLSNMSVG